MQPIVTALLLVFALGVLASLTRAVECGIRPAGKAKRGAGKLNTLIVGGKVVKPHSWPWQVSVHLITNPPLRGGIHICGGSIIDKRWVVTAAHCAFDGNGNKFGVDRFKIDVGRHNLKVKAEDGGSRIDTDKFILHEKYNPKAMDNDIALFHLTKDIVFSKTVKPICLPSKDVKPKTICTVTGWGFTKATSTPAVKLKELALPVIDVATCKKQLASGDKNDNAMITDNMICAYTKGEDSCTGDSGGPFQCQDGNKWYLNGVVSFGPLNCSLEEKAGVYSKVTRFVKWITKITSVKAEGSSDGKRG